MSNHYLLNGLLTVATAKSVCWTLLHSLWEGLACALAAWGILMLTKSSSPALRYRLLLAVFALFIMGVTGTFLTEQNRQFADVPVSGIVSRITFQHAANAGAGPGMQINAGLAAKFGNWLSKNAPLIVLVWGIVICLRLVQLVFSLGYTGSIRRFHAERPAAHWTIKINIWSRNLGIGRKVTLLESLRIRVPVVFGYIKPVIFVPLGLLTSLPAEQAEAILLHELAHIRRQDYLVNLLQYIIETLFFFNPALRWLSAIIRDERESCCDELAIGETGNPKAFVAALVSFREYLSFSPALPVAFPGRNGSLVKRAARIVYKRNNGLDVAEKILLLLGCVMAITLLLVFNKPLVSQALQLPQISKQVIPPNLAQVTLRSAKQTIAKHSVAVDKRQLRPETGKVNTITVKPWAVGYVDADVPYDKERIRQIIIALLHQHVVGDAASIEWFGLDNSQFVVNGQKQPESLHHKFAENFHIEEGHGLYYGPVKVTGTGSFFDQKDLQ